MKKIAIVGGGASGMTCAVLLARRGFSVTILERGERLGRKLSATGNGQGNVTNVNLDASRYFSDDLQKVGRLLGRFNAQNTMDFLQSLGGIFLPDARGRVYPAGRQASAVTDLLRREIDRLGVSVVFGAKVTAVRKRGGEFTLSWEGGNLSCDTLVLSAGGCAAKNFGTDGNGYDLCKSLGHSVSELSPALVQLRCNPQTVRGLKGIRVEAGLTLTRKEKTVYQTRGDVLFTESGISGDAVFRTSSYARKGDLVHLDFLPDVPTSTLNRAIATGGLLCVVNNGLARVLEKRANGNVASVVKNFALEITGTLGFDYAQVTKGGVPLAEVDEDLQSRLCKGLYLTGELLNVDGECGGYNLQWAFTSAHAVAEGIS